MGTISNSLRSISNYPIPPAIIEEVAEDSGLNPDELVTPEIRKSKSFMLAKAGIYDFLSEAPNISQAGISYTCSNDERNRFKLKAGSIRKKLEGSNHGVYGYQGEDL